MNILNTHRRPLHARLNGARVIIPTGEAAECDPSVGKSFVARGFAKELKAKTRTTKTRAAPKKEEVPVEVLAEVPEGASESLAEMLQ